MAKVLYGALKVDGKKYAPGTKVSGLPSKVKTMIRKTNIATVDEKDHPFLQEDIELEDWEVEENDQDEDEE